MFQPFDLGVFALGGLQNYGRMIALAAGSRSGAGVSYPASEASKHFCSAIYFCV